MDQTITFNKFYQERLLEYTDVLAGYESLPASQIKQEWSFYLELTVDACGWQAIWKIPRLTCEKLKIEFPTVVLVYIKNIIYETLNADVSVLSVQDDIDLPKQHCVPLIQLWPTKEQDNSVCLNLTSTANGIDMLRFFYVNLFFPWDTEEDSINWFNKHLVSRLRLYYDLRNGIIPSATADLIKGLLTEARRLQVYQERLLTKIDEDVEINPDPTLQTADVQNLLKTRLRMMEIRNELELLEDPSLRLVLFLNKPTEISKPLSHQIQIWAIFEDGKIDDFLSFFHQIKDNIGNQNVICQSNLSFALENANANDIICLNNSRYVFNSLGALHEGGNLKGMSMEGGTTLSSINEDIMFDCCGDIVLENLDIDVGPAQCGILVRCGTVTLKNCKVVGDYKSSTHQGIIILAGGKLIMENCKMEGFYTGIVINSNASFTLNNSLIQDVNVGVKFYDNCRIEITNTKFKDCVRFGIYMETDKDMCQEGPVDILTKDKDVIVENTSFEGMGKQSAKINHKRKLEPVNNLLEFPELNSTPNQGTCDSEDNGEGEDDDMDISSSSSKFETTIVSKDCTNVNLSI